MLAAAPDPFVQALAAEVAALRAEVAGLRAEIEALKPKPREPTDEERAAVEHFAALADPDTWHGLGDFDDRLTEDERQRMGIRLGDVARECGVVAGWRVDVRPRNGRNQYRARRVGLSGLEPASPDDDERAG
jgi:hypothetical protein